MGRKGKRASTIKKEKEEVNIPSPAKPRRKKEVAPEPVVVIEEITNPGSCFDCNPLHSTGVYSTKKGTCPTCGDKRATLVFSKSSKSTTKISDAIIEEEDDTEKPTKPILKASKAKKSAVLPVKKITGTPTKKGRGRPRKERAMF